MTFEKEEGKDKRVDSLFKSCEKLSTVLLKFGVVAKPMSDKARKRAFEMSSLVNVESLILAEVERLSKKTYQPGIVAEEILMTKDFLKEYSFDYNEDVF